MDPLVLASIVGLVFAGKTLADRDEDKSSSSRQPLPTTKPLTRRQIDMMAHPADHSADYFDLKNTTPDFGRRVGDWRLQRKDAVANLQDVTPTNSRFPYGQPVYDLYNREYITNKMNNVSPLEAPMNSSLATGR